MFKIENIFIQTDVLNFKYCLYISRLPTTQFFNEKEGNLPEKKKQKNLLKMYLERQYMYVYLIYNNITFCFGKFENI